MHGLNFRYVTPHKTISRSMCITPRKWNLHIINALFITQQHPKSSRKTGDAYRRPHIYVFSLFNASVAMLQWWPTVALWSWQMAAGLAPAIVGAGSPRAAVPGRPCQSGRSCPASTELTASSRPPGPPGGYSGDAPWPASASPCSANARK
jgi:hypothetical protein